MGWGVSRIHIDFETRSMADLRACGVYKYAEHPSTDIYCMAWAIDDGPVRLWAPGYTDDYDLLEVVKDPAIEVHAWNAQFESTLWAVMIKRYGFGPAYPSRWRCSMARAAAYGLPLSLDACANLLGLAEKKDDEGHALMMRMCRPRSVAPDGKPTWWMDQDKLDRLYAYCKQDVVVERTISERLKPLIPSEQKLWELDQKINSRGVQLDLSLIQGMKEVTEVASEQANERLAEITGGQVQSVGSCVGLAGWFTSVGLPCTSVDKEAVAAMKKQTEDPMLLEALQIREDAARSSTAKLESMLEYACSDGRAKGMLAFHGASTGRWAGRGPQPHNFPKGDLKNVEQFIPLFLERDIDGISQIAPPLQAASSLLRGCFVAGYNKTLRVADYAAIEARVLAWLAGETELLERFHRGEDVYKPQAADIFSCPIDEVDFTRRQVGKCAVLGLGFQMGAKRFWDAVKKQTGIELADGVAQSAVTAYREGNPRIRGLWKDLERMVIEAMQMPGKIVSINDDQTTARTRPSIKVQRKNNWLIIQLPSGRTLKYLNPELVDSETPWGEVRPAVRYTGLNGMTRRVERVQLYGGIITENIVQAIARDVLADAMIRLDEAGYTVILTVHDEVICETPDPLGTLEEFEKLVVEVPAWATGMSIKAEAWEGKRYKK